jgi:hypothetical protein
MTSMNDGHSENSSTKSSSSEVESFPLKFSRALELKQWLFADLHWFHQHLHYWFNFGWITLYIPINISYDDVGTQFQQLGIILLSILIRIVYLVIRYNRDINFRPIMIIWI